MATVNIFSSETCHKVHLMRCLAFIQARWQVSILAEHIPVMHCPKITWSLSILCSNCPPTQIPETIVNLLVVSRLDWTSLLWSTLWNNIFLQIQLLLLKDLHYCRNVSVNPLLLQLRQFAAALANKSLTAGSIKVYLSAVW